MNDKTMGRTVTITALIAAFLSGTCFAKKQKMNVEMVAYDVQVDGSPLFLHHVDAYFVFPDGTRIHGTCMSGIGSDVSCEPESWTPEKRTANQCQVTNKDSKRCTYQERYYAERKLNDLTIWAANGRIVYHLKDSW